MKTPREIIRQRTQKHKQPQPLVRFITRGLWKTDLAPQNIIDVFLRDGFQTGDTTHRGEAARLYKGRSRVTIQYNGYILPGGASDALDLLDALSRGQ